ncbi:MAG: hypothetical protein GAK35_00473 [Herbaspirillum frisingense]|uniref:Uncharacterized protein n=1 Tax=Herbaspirillum frisingense TaxID=92645 RepID=A0A7V8FZZ2_9BURK|nr:MAG: hypothetical protein GAK35_00473 [Herbaspirillum frisingense]
MTTRKAKFARRAELESALTTLTDAATVLNRRIVTLRAAIEAADQRRRRYRTRLVEKQLLPAISPAVLQRLEQEAPSFVDGLIRETFAQHQRRIAWFAGEPYREALTLMRVRLTRYIDRNRYGELDAIRTELDGLESDKRGLLDGSRQFDAMIKHIKQALRRGEDLSEALWEQLRALLAQLPRVQSPAPRRLRRADDDDDSTALFAFTLSDSGNSMLRDVGSNMADASAFQGTFDGGGASGDWDNGKDSAGDTGGADGRSSDAGRGRDDGSTTMAAAAGAGAVAIATDDSLGLFS